MEKIKIIFGCALKYYVFVETKSYGQHNPEDMEGHDNFYMSWNRPDPRYNGEEDSD